MSTEIDQRDTFTTAAHVQGVLKTGGSEQGFPNAIFYRWLAMVTMFHVRARGCTSKCYRHIYSPYLHVSLCSRNASWYVETLRLKMA